MQIVMAMALLAAGAADGVVLRPVANMYSRSSEEADVVSQTIYASRIGIIEEHDGWAQVRTADKFTGWMPAAFTWCGTESMRAFFRLHQRHGSRNLEKYPLSYVWVPCNQEKINYCYWKQPINCVYR